MLVEDTLNQPADAQGIAILKGSRQQ